MDFLIGQGRVGRLRYFLTSVAIVLVLAFVLVGTAEADPITGEAQVSGVAVVVSLLGAWLQLMNVVRRLRDLGHPWYWLFISIVPILGFAFSLYLLFSPGNPGPASVGFRGPRAANAATGEPVMTEQEAREAYEARNQALLNDDGSFDMDGLYRDSPIRRD